MRIADIYFHDGVTPVSTHEGPVFTLGTDDYTSYSVLECPEWYVHPEDGIRPYYTYRGEGDINIRAFTKKESVPDYYCEPRIESGRMICVGVWPTREAAQANIDTHFLRP